MGGNKKGKIRKYINVFITFLVSGLWHGFYGHFIVWGGLHGLYQVIGDISRGQRKKILPYIGMSEDTVFYRIVVRLVTFFLVTIAWIFFKLGVNDAMRYLAEMLTSSGIRNMMYGVLWNTGLSPFWWFLLFLCCLFVLIIETVQYKSEMRPDMILHSQGPMAKGITIIVLSLIILIFDIFRTEGSG